MTKAPQLTELQQVILEIDALGLPLRDAVRIVNQQVGFFVGQQRYLEELAKAQAARAAAQTDDAAHAGEAART